MIKFSKTIMLVGNQIYTALISHLILLIEVKMRRRVSVQTGLLADIIRNHFGIRTLVLNKIVMI